MVATMLVPLDGSQLSATIIPTLRSLLAAPYSWNWQLLRVVPSDESSAASPTPDTRYEEALAYLAALSQDLKQTGLQVETLALRGDPARCILDQAVRADVELLAMATHGRSGLARWVRGSVAERVLRGSTTPLLLWNPSRGPAAAAGRTNRRVLVPLDGSVRSTYILEELHALFPAQGTELLLLGVEPSRESAEADWQHARLGVLDLFLPRLREAGFHVDSLAILGDPAAAILDTAENIDADLIALASHGRSGVMRWVFGSVAEKVLRSCSRPLLVVRAQA